MDDRPQPGVPAAAGPPGVNRPFGHAMTRRAAEVTVPVRDLREAPCPPRAIPVQGHDADRDLPIRRDGDDVA